VSGAAVLHWEFRVYVFSVIADAQPKHAIIVSDLHLGVPRVCVVESIS
jgi:hypothetical protein